MISPRLSSNNLKKLNKEKVSPSKYHFLIIILAYCAKHSNPFGLRKPIL